MTLTRRRSQAFERAVVGKRARASSRALERSPMPQGGLR